MYYIHPDDESGGLATDVESCREYARNAGMDNPDVAWINTPQDTWERNPFYQGPAVRHPEDDDDYGDDADAEMYGAGFVLYSGDDIPY